MASDALRDTVQRVILENDAFTHLKDCRILVLYCDKGKTRNGMAVYADVEKLSEKHSAISGWDFVITYYKDSFGIGDRALRILTEHELSHVGFEIKPDGEIRKWTVPHDLQDFRHIVEKYGADWMGAAQARSEQ